MAIIKSRLNDFCVAPFVRMEGLADVQPPAPSQWVDAETGRALENLRLKQEDIHGYMGVLEPLPKEDDPRVAWEYAWLNEKVKRERVCCYVCSLYADSVLPTVGGDQGGGARVDVASVWR